MEIQEETETSMKDSIFSELSETVVGETHEEKINTARCMEIKLSWTMNTQEIQHRKESYSYQY